MTKKQKVVFVVVAAGLVLGIILSYVCYHFIYGTRITSREGEAYHKLEGTGVYSPLAVFPSADMDTVSQDFYYQTRDEIFAATCQIYLENQYTREQYEAETERLRNLEFSYQDQTNMLYQDEENYCSVAYVAMANWIDRYEYAITLDDSNTDGHFECDTFLHIFFIQFLHIFTALDPSPDSTALAHFEMFCIACIASPADAGNVVRLAVRAVHGKQQVCDLPS